MECEHVAVWLGEVAVAACAACARLDFVDESGPVEPEVGLRHVFADFDLIDELPAPTAPGGAVYVYAPRHGRARRRLEALPARAWLLAAPHLWLSHDGVVLLSATDHRHLLAGRG